MRRVSASSPDPASLQAAHAAALQMISRRFGPAEAAFSFYTSAHLLNPVACRSFAA